MAPATMQQYNSWNGIVWRSDPDHCDILPRDKGTVGDTIVRPVLASMAGAMLLVSDKPSVYEKDENLEGMKRSFAQCFSRFPGQLYDYDPAQVFCSSFHPGPPSGNRRTFGTG